jgi:hypothetical protein
MTGKFKDLRIIKGTLAGWCVLAPEGAAEVVIAAYSTDDELIANLPLLLEATDAASVKYSGPGSIMTMAEIAEAGL